ncbi:MAG: DUF4136 domain-containing protein [Tannerellaceae bacterium]
MKKVLASLCILGTGFLIGCSTPMLVNSHVYQNQNLSVIQTYRIVKPSEGALPAPMTQTEYDYIASAIRTQMSERGYTESDTSSYMINFGLTSKVKASNYFVPGEQPLAAYLGSYIYPRNNYWPYYYQNGNTVTEVYREGVLIMDIVDAANKNILYTASVEGVMDTNNNQFNSASTVDKAVAKLFANFPAKVN